MTDMKYKYEDFNKDVKIHDVKLIIANEENIQEYGRLVYDFDKEKVWITQWPQTGSRPIYPDTGIQGGETSGRNTSRWEGDLIVNVNHAVDYGRFYYGRLLPGAPGGRTHVLARDPNYHPDGGQVFYPTNGDAFVALLALPGDAVKPEDFVAFYFDGSCGVQIKAGIWHTPIFPSTAEEADFDGKQGAVFACVVMDTVDEFNTYLRVPLTPEFAAKNDRQSTSIQGGDVIG